MQYYLPSGTQGLKLRSFGNETLLFHAASGNTLLLNPIAVELIEILLQATRGKETLLEILSERLDYVLDEDFKAHVDSVLSELIKQEIIAEQ